MHVQACAGTRLHHQAQPLSFLELFDYERINSSLVGDARPCTCFHHGYALIQLRLHIFDQKAFGETHADTAPAPPGSVSTASSPLVSSTAATFRRFCEGERRASELAARF